jgi:hypothetical protein
MKYFLDPISNNEMKKIKKKFFNDSPLLSSLLLWNKNETFSKMREE